MRRNSLNAPRVLVYKPQNKGSPPQALVLSAVVGFALGWTPLLAPIHELGHVLVGVASSGVQVKAMDWTTTYWTGSPSPAFFAAGYYAMVLADAWFSIVASRKRAFTAASFFLGHALTQVPFAFLSHDYFQIYQAYGNDVSLLTFSLFFMVAFLLLTQSLRVMLIERMKASKRRNRSLAAGVRNRARRPA